MIRIQQSRIQQTFEKLTASHKKALITYVTAGDPSLAVTEQLVLAMEEGGADIIELGIPYSDPLADGPVIQRAAKRALQAGTKIDDIFALVANIRSKTQVPLVFLVYFNPVLQYGLQKFLTTCHHSGVDGLIIPDLPLEERSQLQEILTSTGYPIDLIPLVAPTSAQRVPALVAKGSGFVYCIAAMGVTGQREEFFLGLEEFVHGIKAHTATPVALGFGIGSPKAVHTLRDYADGLIVGSAIIQRIEDCITNKKTPEISRVVTDFVRELRVALDSF